MAPKKRPRCSKDNFDELVRVLGDYFKHPKMIGPYSARRDSKSLTRHAAFLVSLSLVQENMSFAPKMMKKACGKVAESKRIAWRFAEEDVEIWANDVSSRVRHMCRHWIQASTRPQQPRWMAKALAETSQPRVEDQSAFLVTRGCSIRPRAQTVILVSLQSSSHASIS